MAAAVDKNESWAPQMVGGETDGDYSVYIRELIPSSRTVYEVLELLGRGTFGQVLKCWKKDSNEVVALKILKNVPSYTRQGQVEIDVLSRLRKHGSEEFNFVLSLESFMHRGHICIVFEMLHMNLYDYLKAGGFQPLPLKYIRPIAQQVLCCLLKLKEIGLVHADLKPENIMLVDQGRHPFRVKVIDFGSASCKTVNTTTTYIQSRYYRAPEVILGLPYTESIDMWSLACVLTELYLGWPLFPGSSEYDQISYICQMLGPPPSHLLTNVSKATKFFTKQLGQWTLKHPAQVQREAGIKSKETRKFIFTSVTAIAQARNHSNSQMTEEVVISQLDRVQFVSLLDSLLTVDPSERASPAASLHHPFISMHHLSMYTSWSSVREIIQSMQVCSVGRSTQHMSHPHGYNLSPLPHPHGYNLSPLPHPHGYNMSPLPHPHSYNLSPSTHPGDLGLVLPCPLLDNNHQLPTTDPTTIHTRPELVDKMNFCYQPPTPSYPYDLYWMLPQYWLSNHH